MFAVSELFILPPAISDKLLLLLLAEFFALAMTAMLSRRLGLLSDAVEFGGIGTGIFEGVELASLAVIKNKKKNLKILLFN